MAYINSRQDLADYCCRQLGAPLLNIEVDDAQMEDAIENAISHYTEYHFDGVTRDYYAHTITGTQITLDSVVGFTVADTLGSVDGFTTKAMITKIENNTVTVNHQIGLTKFALNQQVISWNNTSVSATITNILLGDQDNEFLILPENIVGVTKILNITSVLGSSDYLFNMQYQIMMTELQALTKAGASTYWQTMNYLGHLDFIMKKEKNFNFHRRMNRLTLEIAWGTDINVGDVMVAEVYRMVDPDTYTQVFNDRWIKKYATALIKKQWGTNLSIKYNGMQLPGGLTYNGEKMYDDAVAQIEKLEDEALNSSSVLEFFVG